MEQVVQKLPVQEVHLAVSVCTPFCQCHWLQNWTESEKWRESDGPLFSVIQNSGLRKNKTKVKYPGNFQCTPWGQVPVVCTSADSSRERFSASFSGLVHKGHTVVCWTTQWEPWRTFSFSPWQSPLSLHLMWSISFKDWPNLKVTQHRQASEC